MTGDLSHSVVVMAGRATGSKARPIFMNKPSNQSPPKVARPDAPTPNFGSILTDPQARTNPTKQKPAKAKPKAK